MSLIEGLISYWKFDENSGTLIGDSTGGNTGTTVGANIWTSSGRINSACQFNGSTNEINFGNPNSISNTGNANLSIFAWIKTSTSGIRQSIFSAGTGAVNPNKAFYLFVNTTNNLELDLNNIAGPTSAGTITDGAWHLVGAINTGGTIQLYTDGTTSGAGSALSPNISSGAVKVGTTLPGDNVGTFLYLGTIDEVAYWNRGLSAADITFLYNSGAGIQFSFGSGPHRRRGIGD